MAGTEITEIEACNQECVVKVDTEQVIEIYDSLSDKVYQDLDKQYKEKKISGATYAAIYSDLMKQVIDGSLNAVVSLQSKETSMDRCVKQSQCDATEAKTVRDDAVSNKSMEVSDKDIELKTEQITSSQNKTENETCIATSTCGKNDAEKDLIEAKEKAEDIKNGDDAGNGSLYRQNISTAYAQEMLYGRQKAGFSDNARQKVLDSQLSAWSVAYNNLESWTLPTSVQDASIDAAVATVNTQMGTD